MKGNRFQFRVRFIFGLVAFVACFMIVRLYFLQIVDGSNYNKMADRQYTTVSADVYDRGSIFFQDKNSNLISAASLKTGYIVALNIEQMATDTDLYYKDLSAIVPIDESDFYSKTAKKNDPYEEIAHEVTEDQVSNISALNLPGIIIEKEQWRYYPGGPLACHVIGFVAYNDAGNELEGRYGLEKYYDDTLERTTSNVYVNAFAEIFSNLSQTLLQSKDRQGDVVTSIDPEIQDYVEKTVAAANAKWSSQFTGGIVIDPNTGKIYAMAMYPNFDLNNFSGEKDVSVFGDPLVSNAYEMGSIIKPLTMAAGIDSGAITATSTYNDTGSIKVDGSTIHNFDSTTHGPYGVIPMQIVLNHSLNVGASYVATKMGKPTMLQYFQSYGLGSETGIDMPDEAAGNIDNLLDNLNNSKQVEYDTASFGQGISMTAIQTVQALSILANGGKLITPHVADKIEYMTGLSKTVDYTSEAKQVLKPSTTAIITQMLINVVDQELVKVDPAAQIPGYSVAAKTGTAQIARPANLGGGYYPDQYLHSFFGYFPAYQPRFLIFLYTYEPQHVNYASQTLTDPFFDITKFLINYYQIPPDR